MRLLGFAVPFALLAACAPSINQDARRPSALACIDKPAADRAACFSALPALSEDEPADCKYFSPSHGWIAPQEGLFVPGIKPSKATEIRLKSYARNDMGGVGDVQAASRGCLAAMASELAAASPPVDPAQAERDKQEKAAQEQKQKEEIEARRQVDVRELVEKTVSACKTKWSDDASPCKSPLLNEAETADCARQCADGARAAFDDAVAAAKKACVDSWGAKDSKGECAIAAPQGATVDAGKLSAATSECTAACKKEGPNAQKERAAAQRAAAERQKIVDAYGQCMERGVGLMKLSFIESRKRCLVLTRCGELEAKQEGTCRSARDPSVVP